MTLLKHITEAIGGTPLVQLRSVVPDGAGLVAAKIEYLNPGGSSKDRIAKKIIDAAEKDGRLQPGGTIIEPTSGNTGVGLAMIAQQRGYTCVFVCPDKVGKDKIDVLRAYGADIVVCPSAVEPESPDSYYSVSDRLVAETPGAFKPDQYSNLNGPESHYETTGPEIWRDTTGEITHFVAGIGTGGTITGTGRFLKEISHGRVKVIGADPEGSVYSGGSGRPFLTEGVGEDMWPDTYDRSLVDEVISVTDAEAFSMTRPLAREESLLVGGSSGMAVVAALKVAQRDPSSKVVVLLPDGGRGYLGKIFNDEWMRSYGFDTGHLRDEDELTIADIIRRKNDAGNGLPTVVYVHPNETIRDAVGVLRRFNVSQMPVVGAEPPIVVGDVRGAVSERGLLQAVYEDGYSLLDSVSSVMEDPMPLIGDQERVSSAVRRLVRVDALMVLAGGVPIGVVTRQDLLGFSTTASTSTTGSD
ncbi:cystathionine beta-synthase [Corynebacterium kroppenstedtii]|uniref:cystathionine beta-synthase n=1 Tax=Corynebacterium sp. PCR 32 TaxID=3351342 RepID=UPI0030AD118F